MTNKNKAASESRQPKSNNPIGILPQFERAAAERFFAQLWPEIESGYIGISFKGKAGQMRTEALTAGNWKAVSDFCEGKTGEELYFSLGLMAAPPAKGKRGSVEDIIRIPGLWLDVDCQEGQHSAENLPTFEQAQGELLTEFLPPSVLIHSGGGLHAYWLFPEPAQTEDPDDRVRIKSLSERFQRAFIRFAKEKRSWKLDNTADLARILRIPGSLNHKQAQPKPVRILEESGSRYTIEQLTAGIEQLEAQLPAEVTRQPMRKAPAARSESEPPVPLAPIAESCAWLAHCERDGERLLEQDWYQMLSVVSRTAEGPPEAHEWSRKDPRYDSQETEAKIQHSLRDAGPVTCRKIQEQHGLEYCAGCAFLDEIESPIVIGVQARHEEDRQAAIAAIEDAAARTKDDAGAVLEIEILDQLLRLEKFYPADFERARQTVLNAGVSRKIFNSSLSKQRAKKRQEEAAESTSGGDHGTIDGWRLDGTHLYKRKYSEGSPSWKLISRTAPKIQKVLTSEGEGFEYWEIAFRTIRGRAASVTIPRSRAATKRGLIDELTPYGFDATEGSAADLIEYLRDYDAAHSEELPMQRFLDRFGWTDDLRSFVIGSDVIGEGEIVYQPPGEGEKQLAAAFDTRGSLEEWREVVPLLQGRKWALFKLFQAFVPPILPILEINGWTFSNSGESSQGKTLSDSIAASVWGNVNYNAAIDSLVLQGVDITTDKLEKTLATLRHIPVFLQDAHAAARPETITNALHSVELGKAKGRGSNSNGSQASRTVKTVFFLTSEAPLSSMSENGGIFARAIEYSGSVFNQHTPLFKQQVMDLIFENYGHAGRAFITYLLQNRGRWKTWRADYQASVKEALQDLADHEKTIDPKLQRKIPYFMATLQAAKIAAEALQLPIELGEIEQLIGEAAASHIEKSDSEAYFEKAMNALRDWIASHRGAFWATESLDNPDGSRGEIAGLWNENRGFVALSGSKVKEILSRAGYDFSRCTNEWLKAGYLKAGGDGKIQVKTHLPYAGTKTRMLQIPLEALEASGEEDE
jgi:uncharacterized protein (DUF927 family)